MPEKGIGIQALLCSPQKHNLELSKPCAFCDSKNGMVSLLCKHMHELGLHNESIQYHCNVC
jgi:hypothetical protein